MSEKITPDKVSYEVLRRAFRRALKQRNEMALRNQDLVRRNVNLINYIGDLKNTHG